MARKTLKKKTVRNTESTTTQLKNIGTLYVERTKHHIVENKEFYTGMGTAAASYGAYELLSNVI